MRRWRVALVAVAGIALLLAGLTVIAGCAQKNGGQTNAAFSVWPASGSAPLEVEFYDQSTGEIDSWAWDFDNDGVVDSTEQYPSYTYDVPGTYSVALTVVGPEGSAMETKTDYVHADGGTVDGEPTSVSNDSATKGLLLYLDSEIGDELETDELVEKVGPAVVSILQKRSLTTGAGDQYLQPAPALG